MEIDERDITFDIHTILKRQQELNENGFIVLKNFFPKTTIKDLKSQASLLFENLFHIKGYDVNDSFRDKMIRLFQDDEEAFKNAGKLIQTGLLELYKLALDEDLIETVVDLGVMVPCMCTRPVLYFNHPKLAKSEVYYKTPPHQDYPSMLSSLNSVVVWIPLVDVSEQNGSIILYPGSHKNGVLPNKLEGGFAQVERPNTEAIQPTMKVGDIAIFDSMLVHESGEIKDNSIRWSCHFRYTDLMHDEHMKRGYISPYIYKPITKQ